jgi:hypothetical protein
MAVSTTRPERRTNLTWLTLWLASMKPAASSRRLISRNGCGLSRPNLDLNGTNFWELRGLRRLEVKFQGFLQIGESLFLGLTLAGDVDFEALRNIPISFAPDCRSKRSFHFHILPQDSQESYFRGLPNRLTTLRLLTVPRRYDEL